MEKLAMMNQFYAHLSPVFALLMIWSLAWKGVALWKAARKEDKVWFVILLVVNTIGILDILYFYLISKRKNTKS